MPKKFLIYCSDAYYPGVDVFTEESIAKAEWEKLKERRKTENPKYIDTDYFAEVIEENKVGNEGD